MRKYGWHKPKHPVKHISYSATFDGSLPGMVDLRPKMPAVYDQGELGACTAHAIAGLSEYLMIKSGKKPYVPSRLFIYYNERVLEETVLEDSGASIADSMRVVTTNGCPNEAIWWYNVVKYAIKPNQKVYINGLTHLVSDYYQVNQDLNSLRSILALGYPIAIGFTVYESFEYDVVTLTGVMPMPKPDEEVLGGHAVLVVGYDDEKRMFIVRNSWSKDWGGPMEGYFLMPYDFLLDPYYASDFWFAKSIA